MVFSRRSQRDFEDEIRSHIELEQDRLIAEGLSPDAARFAAKRRFGNVGVAQERFHDSGRFVALVDVGNDVRYALRMLRKTPGFTVIAAMTLALGIGANTAVFSVVNGVLLTPLPYRDPSRIVRLWETLPGVEQMMVSYPDYLDWQQRARVFDEIALYSPFSSMSLTGGDIPERVGVGEATANLFPLLGLAPLLGRGIHAEDDRPGAPHVALLTEHWWRVRFGGDANIVGRRLTLDGETYSVVGVIPRTVGLGSVDLWVPLGVRAGTPDLTRANHPGLIGVGRLKAGVTLAQMNADLERISSQLRTEYPQEDAGIGASGGFLAEILVKNVKPALKMLVWAVALVLLIACVNVANLLLSRSTVRRKEMALRTALGASRSRVMRLLLVENLLLAVIGGVAGVGLAYAGVRAVLVLQPVALPRLTEIQIDLRVLGFAALMSIVTGLLFGFLPARQLSRIDLAETIKAGGRGSSASGASMRLRGTLMTVEVALAMMLIVGAGLLIRSFARLTRVDPGVDAKGIATGWISLPVSKYPNAERQRLAIGEILRRVEALPGVTSAAIASSLPLSANMQNRITFQGHPRPNGQEPLINVDLVSPKYFATMKMRLIAGRGIEPSDVAGTTPVAVISEFVAKQYFPNENPIGKQIVHGGFDSKEPPTTVVGVVSDIKETDLDERTVGMIYFPFDQGPQSWIVLAARSALPAEQILAALRRTVAGFDRELPLGNEDMLENTIGRSLGQQRFAMFMLGVFALIALLLAAIGVYGVIAFFVAQRSHEIGIRMALGAQRRDIVSLISGRVLATTGTGVTVGLAGAAAASGVMRNLLFEVAAVDGATYVVGAVTLIGAACLAALVPTVGATRVNPASAMRAE